MNIFKKKDKYTIVEKVQKMVFPFIVDFDLKFKEELTERQYNNECSKRLLMIPFLKWNNNTLPCGINDKCVL